MKKKILMAMGITACLTALGTCAYYGDKASHITETTLERVDVVQVDEGGQ